MPGWHTAGAGDKPAELAHPPAGCGATITDVPTASNVIEAAGGVCFAHTLFGPKFWSSRLGQAVVLTYNLSVLFSGTMGWQQKVTIHSLRFWLFPLRRSAC